MDIGHVIHQDWCFTSGHSFQCDPKISVVLPFEETNSESIIQPI